MFFQARDLFSDLNGHESHFYGFIFDVLNEVLSRTHSHN